MDYFDILFAKTNGISSSTCYNEIEAMLKSTVGHSSKNLLKIVADSQTINGVTFTVDKTAGTITANGQVKSSSTAQFDFIPRRPIDSRINGLILTEPKSATTPNYGLRTSIAYYNASNQFISEQTINSGRPNPIVVSLPSGAASYKVYVRVTASVGTLNNVVIKPMLREASISDDTFEPYVTPTDEKKQDKIKTIYVAPSLEDATNEIIIPRSNDINLFVVVCLADGDTDTAVTFIVPQELFGYPCVNGDFSITGSIVDSAHNKLTFGFPNTFSAGKIIRVLGVPNISYEAEE